MRKLFKLAITSIGVMTCVSFIAAAYNDYRLRKEWIAHHGR